MNARTLKIVLAVSVALNIFAAAGAVAAWARWNAVESRVEETRRPPRGASVLAIVDGLQPATRDRVREAMKSSALAARNDFEEARSTRREAVESARGETFDPGAVNQLLERSRQAEMRGRARLETDSVGILATLEPAERQALAPILQRHRQRMRDARPQRAPREP